MAIPNTFVLYRKATMRCCITRMCYLGMRREEVVTFEYSTSLKQEVVFLAYYADEGVAANDVGSA